MSVRNDRAEVGVGTLIIFIAMVLVAAVAAAVLIGTGGELQARAQQTGVEAIQDVSGNLRVVAITGARNDTASDIYDVKLYVEPAAGAKPMDLARLVLRYSDGSNVLLYAHTASPLSDGAPPQTQFATSWIRGGTPGSAVLQTGELAEIHFNLYDTSLAPRQTVEIKLIPETGSVLSLEFRTPNTYVDAVNVQLS